MKCSPLAQGQKQCVRVAVVLWRRRKARIDRSRSGEGLKWKGNASLFAQKYEIMVDRIETKEGGCRKAVIWLPGQVNHIIQISIENANSTRRRMMRRVVN